jgi:xyloglucan-specific exo-beta-1,4-glucanase
VWDSVYGLWHSTDSGLSFAKLANVQEADNVGFGKAAPGQNYPAIYIPAKVGGLRGIYRSDDGGATWLRINDDQHQWGVAGAAAITGDPRIYGRVYLSTNGRGIIYGDLGGGGCASSAVSVDSITVTTVAAGKGKKRGQATITVKDDCGAPVANATIFGAFSGSLNESVSGVTNANGVVTLLTNGSAGGTVSVTFCVTNVTHASLTYDSAGNVETCDHN